MDEIDALSQLIINSKFTVAFAGAGLSQESGIPTFRGDEGIWKKFPPIIFGNIFGLGLAFLFAPQKFFDFVLSALRTFIQAKPNPAHYALAELYQKGLLKAVITQNIDDLERKAGVEKVVQLHGNIYRMRCLRCKYRFMVSQDKLSQFLSELEMSRTRRQWIKKSREFARCPKCSSWSRPDVVFFGESLDPNDVYQSMELARSCDLMIILGTSGVVQPASLIPKYAKDAGAKLVEINPEPTALSSLCDLVIRDTSAKTLPQVLANIEKMPS